MKAKKTQEENKRAHNEYNKKLAKDIRNRNEEGKEFSPHYVRVDIEEANDHGANDHI